MSEDYTEVDCVCGNEDCNAYGRPKMIPVGTPIKQRLKDYVCGQCGEKNVQPDPDKYTADAFEKLCEEHDAKSEDVIPTHAVINLDLDNDEVVEEESESDRVKNEVTEVEEEEHTELPKTYVKRQKNRKIKFK